MEVNNAIYGSGRLFKLVTGSSNWLFNFYCIKLLLHFLILDLAYSAS